MSADLRKTSPTVNVLLTDHLTCSEGEVSSRNERERAVVVSIFGLTACFTLQNWTRALLSSSLLHSSSHPSALHVVSVVPPHSFLLEQLPISIIPAHPSFLAPSTPNSQSMIPSVPFPDVDLTPLLYLSRGHSAFNY